MTDSVPKEWGEAAQVSVQWIFIDCLNCVTGPRSLNF